VSRFLLMAAAVGVVGILALLLFGGEDGRDLRLSERVPLGFVTPFRYDPLSGDLDSTSGEVVTLKNYGDEPIDVSGWTLSNERGTAYEFPEGFSLAPGAQVSIHSGCGQDSNTDLYWCSRHPLWDDSGGVASLSMPDGTQVIAFAYGGCASCSI